MNKSIKQIVVTYISTIIMLMQGVSSVSTPYRAAGLIIQASKVVAANPFAFALTGGAVATIAAPKAKAASAVQSATTTCPDGYTRSGSQCYLKETTPILESCSTDGYTADTIYEDTLGTSIDTCVKYHQKYAEVVCGTNEESGGTYGQQCRTVSEPSGSTDYQYCPTGKTLSDGKCYGAWYTPSTSSYVCADLCNVELSSPTDTCPTVSDPIANIEPISATCTTKGIADGSCYSGQVVELQMPNLDWAMESPVTPMTSGNPIMCYRSSYESVVRECPTPNIKKTSSTEPEWETPSGSDAENDAYYDDETGVVTTCIRTWYDDVINSCSEGLTYDYTLGGCVDSASITCAEGYTYSNGQCVSPAGEVTCTSDHTYDENSGTCVLNVDDSISFAGAYAIGADFGYAVGGVQKSKTQSADQSGNVTLDMGLLNEEANSELQINSSSYSSVSTIGENDSANNSYADISDTYWNEDGQTVAITTNYNSYQNYLADDSEDKTPNLAAEAYAVVDDTIELNRPSGIDTDDEWLAASQSIQESVGDGTNTYFGDCDTAATTKTVLDTSKQIVTQSTCRKPVIANYNSCQVKRKVTEPNLKILEGADNADVEILDSKRIKLTLGVVGDDYLSPAAGESCGTKTSDIVLQFASDVNVEKATFYSAEYDDIFVLSADGEEFFRGPDVSQNPWRYSGWPSSSDNCELGTHWIYSGTKDVTEAFQTAMDGDSKISFNYKAGIGGEGEAFAYVILEFDTDILTDWEFENYYEPEGCLEKIESSYYTTSGWECDLGIDQDRTIGMEDWTEWDSVHNWNITNDGYDATSTLNGAWSAYGSDTDVGEIWFEGNITMPGDDDDTFGFIIGYPENPVWNKDPKSSDYVPESEDDENNHYYMILWTSNYDKNGPFQGLHMVKSYANYTTLENRFGNWGINYPEDKYETDAYGNSVLVVDNIYSNTSLKWAHNKKYEFEIYQDEYGYFYFDVDGTKYIDFGPDDYEIPTGRFAFTSVSLKNVKLTGLTKLFDLNMPPLFDGDDDPSICMMAHANDVSFDPLSGGTLNGLTYEQILAQPDTCSDLEDDTTCSWAGRGCIEGFETSDGDCLYEEETYTCVDNSNAWVTEAVESTCDQVIPCTDGDDCNTRTSGENTDFANVVSQIAVVNEMSNYMDCGDDSDYTTCQVFSGEKRYCSYDQFGMIDCCEEYKGKTLDLFKLATNMISIASYADSIYNISGSVGNMVFGTDGTIIGSGTDGGDGWVPDNWWGLTDTASYQTVTTGYSDLQSGATTAWDSVTTNVSSWFSSQTTNSAGTTDAEVAQSSEDANSGVDKAAFTDFVKDKAVGYVQGVLINYATNYIVAALPAAIQQAMVNAATSIGMTYTTSTGAQAAVTATTPATTVASSAMASVASFMTAVSAAYAAVQIALALYQKFNGCDEVEMDMPQEIKSKECFFAYKQSCNKKWGICMNKHKDKYCCFDSLLARLMMQQIITQSDVFGQSYTQHQWYDSQQCRGLTLSEVALADFSEVDLTEWYQLMVQSETLPDSETTLEELTQDASYVNPYGRTDALTLQESVDERDIETLQDYRDEVDGEDILSTVDCSESSNIQGCQTGIFSD